MLNRWIVAVVRAAAQWPAIVVSLALAVTALSIAYTSGNFALNTSTASLLSPDIPWRQREAHFERVFPGRSDVVLVVIDGATPELAELAAARLSERLAANTQLFHFVRRPDGGFFFERHGLLFLDTAELQQTLDQLIAAQPLLGTLAQDPTARGLLDALSLALEGVRRGEAPPEALTPTLNALDATVQGVLEGRSAPFSLRALMIHRDSPASRELRRFILVKPVLDYGALMPGADATDAIRAEARALGLDASNGARVRLTGDVPLADEEFGTLARDAGLNASLMALSLVVLLWLAAQSLRIVAAILLTLAAGLAWTAALGLALFGTFNLISVAFAVLFVGLGVDFGIQFAVSYRAHRREETAAVTALASAARQVGQPLALACASTALGFFAFLPTEYRGISELGAIAGTGMLIAFGLTLTLLPALLRVLGSSEKPSSMGYVRLAWADRFLVVHRRKLMLAVGLVAFAAALAAPRVRFDSNPLHLRSAQTESVSTLVELMGNPQTNPNTISVLTRSHADARKIADQLAALPEVAQTVTLTDFVPADQEAKLALIADAALLLDVTLNPGSTAVAPDDSALAAATRRVSHELQQLKTDAVAGDLAARLQRGLASLADGEPAQRATFERVVASPIVLTLTQLRRALTAAPVTMEQLPPDLARDWIGTDGSIRVEVHPQGDVDDTENLSRFVTSVQTLVPQAAGPAVSLVEGSRTIVRAFFVAGFWAWLAITLLLALVLRRVRDIVLTLAPLALAGIATLALCVAFGIDLNFENIIALPLLLGIGVAFNIYFVMAWRAGTGALLQSSLARAIIFSALTTSVAFGSLWLSSHPGTASMGELLIISLVCTLVCTLVVLPVLLGPAPVPESK